MIRQNTTSNEERSYESDECQIDSESERWTSIPACEGRKIQRVWNENKGHEDQESCVSEPPSDIPSGVDLNNDLHHHPSHKENSDPYDQMKIKRLATPKFTLKPTKPITSLENCCADPQNGQIHEQKSQVETSFTEIRSVSCLTKSKVDCSDFYSKDDNSTNTRIYQISTQVHRSTKMNRTTEDRPQGEDCDDLRTQDRVLQWLNSKGSSSLENITGEGAAEKLHSQMERAGDSALEDDINAANNSLVEKYVTVTTIKSSSIKGDIEEESVYHKKQLSVQGVGNGIPSSQAQHFVSSQDHEPFIVPMFDPSVMSTVKETVKSFCVEGSNNQIAHTTKNPIVPSSDKPKLPMSFKDISFHYQSKDNNFEELTPTGFSINFDYPSTPLEQKTSHGKVSTYFPGNKIKGPGEDPENEIVSPIPKYLLEFQGKNDEKCKDSKTAGPIHGTYQMETLKPPTPCRTTSVSNLSMIPLVHSEATIGSMSPSQKVLVDGGCYSDHGFLGFYGLSGQERRRRGHLAKRRPGTKEMADFGRKVLNLMEQNDHSDIPSTPNEVFENRPISSPLPALFASRFPNQNLESDTPQPQVALNLSNGYLTNDAESRSNQKIVTDRVGRKFTRNSGGRVQRNVKVGTTKGALDLRHTTQSDDCVVASPEHQGFWNSWKRAMQTNTPTSVSKVAAWKRGSIGKVSSINAFAAKSSSHRSLASNRSSRSSSRNFVRENIDRIKISAMLKMPKEERPPLPKDERMPKAEIGVSKSKASGSVLPRKTAKIKVKTVKSQPGAMISMKDSSPSIEPLTEASRSGLLDSTESTTVKGKKTKVVGAKAKKGAGAQKPVAAAAAAAPIPDPYYAQATPSERELIVELVKADVDAMLNRDATANTSKPSSDDVSQLKQSGSAVSNAFSTFNTPKHAAHWAHGLQSTPVRAGYSYNENSPVKPKRPSTGGKGLVNSSGKKAMAFDTSDNAAAGPSGYSKNTGLKTVKTVVKSKTKKQ